MKVNNFNGKYKVMLPIIISFTFRSPMRPFCPGKWCLGSKSMGMGEAVRVLGNCLRCY